MQVQLDRQFQALGAFEKLGEKGAHDVFQRGSLKAATILQTTFSEQRSTSWMRFESLEEALDPGNRESTVEGWPAPVRAAVVGRRPA